MLHDLKEAAVNVTTIAVTAGLGLAFLGVIGVIVAREAYRDWKGEKIKPVEVWEEKKWPDRVMKTLADEDPQSGLDVL